MENFAISYRNNQRKISETSGTRQPPCVHCPNEQINKCGDGDLSELRDRKFDPCELFDEYARGHKKGSGKTGRVNGTHDRKYKITKSEIAEIRLGSQL